MSLPPEEYMELVERALAEDIGDGDITTGALGLGDLKGEARIRAKDQGIVAGLFLAEAVFRKLDPDTEFEAAVEEGAQVRPGNLLATVRGRAAALLAGERVALNFLQRLSGIATLTFMFVRAVKGTKTAITDTRKTTPGLRALEKYAVRAGGGQNHRFGLFDAVLIKDNHIKLAGGIAEAVRSAREKSGGSMKIELETRSLGEVRQALDAGADTIMLDNFPLEDIEKAVGVIAGRATVEVSGGVNMLTVTHIAEIGVDSISIGALTHSPDALDISMQFEIVDSSQGKDKG